MWTNVIRICRIILAQEIARMCIIRKSFNTSWKWLYSMPMFCMPSREEKALTLISVSSLLKNCYSIFTMNRRHQSEEIVQEATWWGIKADISTEKFPPTEKKANPTWRCAVCYQCGSKDDAQKKREETQYWCKQCAVALCAAPCLEVYHAKTAY